MNPMPLLRQGNQLYYLELPLLTSLKQKKKNRKQTRQQACRKVVFDNIRALQCANLSISKPDLELARKVLHAWKRLGRATASANTFYDLILVLSHTTSHRDCKIVTSSKLGYEPVDIRDQLADRETVAKLLRTLEPFWPKVITKAKSDRILPINKLSKLHETIPEPIDLFLYFRCGIEIPITRVRFTETVCSWLLPCLPQGQSTEKDLTQLAEWFEYATLLPNANWICDLLRLVVRKYPIATSWRWCQLLLENAGDSTFLQANMIIQRIDESQTIDDEALQMFTNLERIYPNKNDLLKYTKGWDRIFDGLNKGFTPAVINTGLRIWFQTQRAPDFHSFVAGQFPHDHFLDIEAAIYRRKLNKTVPLQLRMTLFNLVGKYPRASRAIVALSEYPNQTTSTFLVVLKYLIYEVEWEDPSHLDKGRVIRLIDFCENGIDREDHGCLQFFTNYFEYKFCRRKGTFKQLLMIAKRHFDLGLKVTWNMASIWVGLVQAATDEQSIEKLNQLPDSTYKAIQQFSRNNNRCYRAARGSWRFCWRRPIDALEMLKHFPARYLSVMLELHNLKLPTQRLVFDSYKMHPACEVTDWRKNLKHTQILIDGIISRTEFKNPIPRRLRSYINGERLLEPKIIDRDLTELEKNSYYLRLEILEKEIQRCLPVPESDMADPIDAHTLMLAHEIRQNRRPLKRYIREARYNIESANNYIKNHPNNNLWLKRLNAQGVDAESWVAGLTLHTELENHGAVKVAPETNPEEVLKMGTYVGSCLALGNCNSWSAVANLFDVNKQVIYIRDETNKVIGRQLIALSAEADLVCFEIYPSQTQPIVELMYQYDRLLAKKLNLPLFDWEKDSYKIDNLVCKDWYDDYAIDIPKIE